MLAKPRARLRHVTPLMLCAFFLLLAGAVSGCGMLRFGAAPTVTPDAATIVQRAGKASYRDATFTLTVSDPTEGNTNTPLASGTGAITTSPARTHFTLKFAFDFSQLLPTPTPSVTPDARPSATPGASQTTIEIITDAATNTTYMRMTGFPSIGVASPGEGQWIKTTVSGDVPTGSRVDTSSITGLMDLGKVKTAHLIGVETLEDVKVYHLQSTVTTTTTYSGASFSLTTVTDYYVRQDNYRTVKLVANSSSQLSATSAGSKSTSTTTLTFTAYDTGVTIDLPQV
jgi:hypothetical protein